MAPRDKKGIWSERMDPGRNGKNKNVSKLLNQVMVECSWTQRYTGDLNARDDTSGSQVQREIFR